MRIHESKPDQIRSDTAGRIREEAAGGSESKARALSPVGRADRVEISDEARALAEKAQAEAAIDIEGPPQPVLTPEQLEALRGRVEAGYYDRPEVLDQVADRLLDSGDL